MATHKLELWNEGDRSVGIYGDNCTIELNLPVMTQDEINEFCYEQAMFLQDSIFEGFFTAWDLTNEETKTIISYGNTRTVKKVREI